MSQIKLSILSRREVGKLRKRETAILAFSFSLFLIFSLSSCGFTPVYGHGTGEAGNPKLAAISIEEIPTRDGQVLRNKLTDLLNPDNDSAHAQYKLVIKLEKQRREFGIQKDFRITRYDLRMNTEYQLIDLKTNDPVLKDNAVIYSSFNRTASEFSTFVGEEDASEKAAEQLAQEIKAKLAAFFE